MWRKLYLLVERNYPSITWFCFTAVECRWLSSSSMITSWIILSIFLYRQMDWILTEINNYFDLFGLSENMMPFLYENYLFTYYGKFWIQRSGIDCLDNISHVTVLHLHLLIGDLRFYWREVGRRLCLCYCLYCYAMPSCVSPKHW